VNAEKEMEDMAACADVQFGGRGRRSGGKSKSRASSRRSSKSRASSRRSSGSRPRLTRAMQSAAVDASVVARRARAAYKAAISKGSKSVSSALHSSSEAIQRMRVSQLLRAVPGIGKERAAKLLETAGVSPKHHLSGLTDRQKASILDLLRARKSA
jgi:predicted flap endonuclease-1-like 5' DNA nuclease